MTEPTYVPERRPIASRNYALSIRLALSKSVDL